MTLSEQFAQVRAGIPAPHAASNRYEHRNALAALSSIERHVQDMEKALRDEFFRIVPDLDYETEGLLGGVAWAWEVHPWYVLLGLTEAECIAALPAREKEEETNG